jgi:pimeloyl-ACP methyl ester carboxylesterase
LVNTVEFEDHFPEIHGRKEDIGGSHLKVLEKCGHSPQEECPVKTFSAIKEFLASGEYAPHAMANSPSSP